MNKLVLTPGCWADLRSHLLQNRLEQVAFVFARTTATEDGVLFDASDHYVVQPEEFAIHSEYHVTLGDEVQGRLIKRAWDTDTSLVEMHSHPHSRGAAQTRFSPSDLAGFGEFVPHVWWRLRGRPYLAVVVGPVAVDAMVWRRAADTPEDLDAVEAGPTILRPTGLTLAELRKPRVIRAR